MVCANLECPFCYSEPKLLNDSEENQVAAKACPSRRRCALVTAKQDFLYVLGGCQFPRYTNFNADCVWAYDFAANEWTLIRIDGDVNKIERQFKTNSYEVAATAPGHSEEALFFITKFDYDCLEEDATRRQHFFLLKIGPKQREQRCSRLEQITFVDQDGSLADFPLESAYPSVFISSAMATEIGDGDDGNVPLINVYFVTTTNSYSFQDRCDHPKSIISIFELSSPRSTNEGSGWNWNCLTHYDVSNRNLVANDMVNAECVSLMANLGSDFDCFLYQKAIWIFVFDCSHFDYYAEKLYRKVIHFDLTTRKFSVVPLIADPLAGYPKSRRRHSPVLHRDCFYLVPGVQNSEDAELGCFFINTIWRLDLKCLCWKKLSNWQMQIPCIDYSATSRGDNDNSIIVFGGISVSSAEANYTLGNEDDFHPKMNTQFLNNVQILHL